MLLKGSEKPLVGLVVLIVAVILVDCVRMIHDALPDPPAPTRQAREGCFYQILEDEVVVGNAFSAGPEVLSEILATAGMSDRFTWVDGSLRIPCDRCLKFRNDSRLFSVESIPAALLMAALRRIDINRAEETDLLALPGIGPRTAENIVRRREQAGGFSCLDDLRTVPGIGKKKLAAIAPYIEVRAPEAIRVSREAETR
jgi:competence ComEA-like helix-hairpin-helix protein